MSAAAKWAERIDRTVKCRSCGRPYGNQGLTDAQRAQAVADAIRAGQVVPAPKGVRAS